MAEVAVKPEIKLDQGDGDVQLADVEEFEEDTDLQFPSVDAKAWFARIPEDLWAAWHEIYENAPEDAQIEVGKMRVYQSEKELADDRDQKIEILLQKGIAETKALPQKYTLKIQTRGYNNTVVFSEKDLPGHSTRTFGRNRYLTQQKTSAGINKSERYQKKSGYASAIPKQTALAPPIEHEAIVSAQIDAEDFFSGTAGGVQAPAANVTTFQFDNDNRQPGRATFSSSFTTTSRPLNRKKKPKEKFVRMEQQQLYDAIYKCFGQYKYWRLGALRKELRQPEAYIKQGLETVASLVKSGDFAGCWTLKPEYAQLMKIDESQVKNESAAVDSAPEDATDGGTGDEMDDDDLGDLEDVKMEDG